MARIRPHPIWGLGNRQPTDLRRKRNKFGSTTRNTPKQQTEKELSPTNHFRTPSSFTPTMMGGMGDMAPSLHNLNRNVLQHIAMRKNMGLREKDVAALRQRLGIRR